MMCNGFGRQIMSKHYHVSSVLEGMDKQHIVKFGGLVAISMSVQSLLIAVIGIY